MKDGYKEIIKIKADLLCYGIRENHYSEEFYKIQNPSRILKGGGYVGLHFLLNGKIPILASTTFKFDRMSKFEIKKNGDSFYLIRDDGFEIPINLIQMPEWYSKKTISRKPMSSIFAHEGLHYLHQQYAGCGFQMIGKGCKFCGTGCKWLINSPEEIAETALIAYKENEGYQVCLGGGARLTPSYGSGFFLNCINLIRKKNKRMPIWIEMIPPELNIFLNELISAGASGFGFNLEIWDNALRKEICPGKSKISKERYFEAWKFVQGKLDKNKANTVLIACLEPFKSTLEGIHKISQEGVRITLLPFKPWDNSVYADKKPANPEDLYKLALALAKDMVKYGIDSDKSYGCANCDSCTLEEDIRKYLL